MRCHAKIIDYSRQPWEARRPVTTAVSHLNWSAQVIISFPVSWHTNKLQLIPRSSNVFRLICLGSEMGCESCTHSHSHNVIMYVFLFKMFGFPPPLLYIFIYKSSSLFSAAGMLLQHRYRLDSYCRKTTKALSSLYSRRCSRLFMVRPCFKLALGHINWSSWHVTQTWLR